MAQEMKTKNKSTTALFVVVPLITLVIAFLAFSYFSKTFVFAEEPRSYTTNHTYSMEEIIVNLKGGERYLKIKIALGYNMEEDEEAIKQKEAQERDAILSVLRSKSAEDIMPIENADGLKTEIQDKLNQFFPEKIITDVFITDFLVQ
jgi:flagellar FliL protein